MVFILYLFIFQDFKIITESENEQIYTVSNSTFFYINQYTVIYKIKKVSYKAYFLHIQNIHSQDIPRGTFDRYTGCRTDSHTDNTGKTPT